jgi:hypothetical protein
VSRARRWSGVLSLLTLSLLAAEGLLQLLAWRAPAVDRVLTPVWAVPPRIRDPLLGERGNPRWYDHDSRGFRNRSAARHAQIVTLGDSQTYGVSADRRDTWPWVLGERSERVVYNMAFPGWGPGEAYLLLDSALALRPAVVVFGLYFGNDFYDVFALGARLPDIRAFLPPRLDAAATEIERATPLAASVRFLGAAGDTARPPGRREGFDVRRLLSEHSKLYAVARAIRSLATGDDGQPTLLSRNLDRALAEATDAERQFVSVFRGPEWQTLFTAPYRNRVLDDRDPWIRAGVEATLSLLARMDRLCRDRETRFVVVLLPTKESVFAPRVGDLAAHPALDSLVGNEARLRDEIVTALDRAGVAHVDALDALRHARSQPYFEDADGHPNPVGHGVIAGVVEEWLARDAAPPVK